MKQVHIIIDELARALDDIEDTIQIENNVRDSLYSLNGSKQLIGCSHDTLTGSESVTCAEGRHMCG